jgi:hypothetical protein
MKIQPDPSNPNRMDADDKARMARSLAEFGDLSGVILNRRTGLLVGGHQRADVLAGADLHVNDLPAPEPDGTVGRGWLEHGGRRYAVRVVDWDDVKAKTAMLAANEFGRRGENDPDKEKAILELLDASNADMELTGKTLQEIEAELTAAPPELPSIPALELRPYEHFDYVVVLADNVHEWEWLCEFCDLEKVDGRNEKSGAKIGLGRGVRASTLIAKIKEARGEAGLRSCDSVAQAE